MKKSAGILVFRKRDAIELFLVHPGGPFFKNKDAGAWTIPKGEINEGEDPLIAAQREFFEETGVQLQGSFAELKPIKQKSGKIVHAWAIEHDIDETKVSSNTFSIEWPPKSKRMTEFPEIDKAQWFTISNALQKIIPAQAGLIEELVSFIG